VGRCNARLRVDLKSLGWTLSHNYICGLGLGGVKGSSPPPPLGEGGGLLSAGGRGGRLRYGLWVVWGVGGVKGFKKPRFGVAKRGGRVGRRGEYLVGGVGGGGG